MQELQKNTPCTKNKKNNIETRKIRIIYNKKEITKIDAKEKKHIIINLQMIQNNSEKKEMQENRVKKNSRQDHERHLNK